MATTRNRIALVRSYIGSAMVAVAGLLIGGCVSAPSSPEPVGSEVGGPVLLRSLPMIAVAPGQLLDYWQWQEPLSVQAPASSGRNLQYGCVAVHFAIDAEGQSFDVQVRKSYPQGRFVEPVLAWVKDWQFVPTESNPVRQPVRTDYLLTVQSVDGELRLVEADHVARFCR